MTPFLHSRTALLAGLAVILALFVEEGWHLHRWDSKGEMRMVHIEDVPTQCKAMTGTSVYMHCAVPGYGMALYRCVKDICYYQEPSARFMSAKEMEEEDAAMGRMFALGKDEFEDVK